MTEPTNSTEIPNDLHDESSTIIEPQIPEHIEHTNNHEHDSDDFDDDFDDDEFEDDSDSDLDDDFKSAIYSLHDFIVEHDFFNTQVNYTIGNQQISLIIIRKPITKYITRHLKSYIKIKQNDPLLSETCPICFNSYEIGQYKRSLSKCHHTYHKKCIDKWFSKNINNMSCPICRENYNLIIDLE